MEISQLDNINDNQLREYSTLLRLLVSFHLIVSNPYLFFNLKLTFKLTHYERCMHTTIYLFKLLKTILINISYLFMLKIYNKIQTISLKTFC